MTQLFVEQRNNIYPEIPNDFVVLEYIQSSGTQYIDTGFASTTGYTGKAGVELLTKQVQIMVGTQYNATDPSSSNNRNMVFTNATNFQLGCTNAEYTGSSYSINTKYDIEFSTKSNYYLTVDGTQQLSGTNTSTRSVGNINLFAGTRRGVVGWFSNMKLYYCQLWDSSDTLVRDFVPVKNTISDEIGMYDLVRRKFYTNQGTGTFTAGPEIKQVEYIQSSGSQYINTGVSNNSDLRVIMDFIPTALTSSGWAWIFGGRDVNTAGGGFGFASNGSKLYLSDYGGDRQISNVTMVVNQEVIVDKNKNICNFTIDSTTTTLSNTSTTFSGTNALYLFSINAGGSASDSSMIKLYYCKIYDDEALVRNFIPIKYGPTYAMYDLVDRKVYTNAGTGAFTGGDEIAPEMKLRVGYDDRIGTAYEVLDYIQSSGEQYIDTNIGYTTNTKVECKFKKLSTVGVGNNLFGSGNSFGNSDDFSLWCQDDSGLAIHMPYPYVDTGYKMTSVSIKDDVVFTADTGTRIFTLNDQSYSIGGTTTSGSSNPILLFTFGPNYQYTSYFIGRVYYWKQWDNGTLVRDFVPVRRKSDSVVGMYDKVNNVFYTNAGSGTFTAGNVIQPTFRVAHSNKLYKLPIGYTACEYIQSTGTQYIDTGIELTSEYTVELDYQLTETGQIRRGLFGKLIADTGRFGSLLSPSSPYKLEHGYGVGNIWWQQGAQDTDRHYLKQVKNKIYFDGELVYTFSAATFSISGTVALGNFGYTNYSPAKAKYYSSKWYNGDTLVRHFIPCLNTTTNKYGMYDIVTKTFYGNAGTGDFVGPT